MPIFFGIVGAIALVLGYLHFNEWPCEALRLCSKAADHRIEYRIKTDNQLFEARVGHEKAKLDLEIEERKRKMDRDDRTETVKEIVKEAPTKVGTGAEGFILEDHEPPEKLSIGESTGEFYLEPHDVPPMYKHSHGYAPRLVIKERPLYRVHPGTSIRVCSGYINGPCPR